MCLYQLPSQLPGDSSPPGCDQSSHMDHFLSKFQASRPRTQQVCMVIGLQFCPVLFLVALVLSLDMLFGFSSYRNRLQE